jgi:hypothetical protein
MSAPDSKPAPAIARATARAQRRTVAGTATVAQERDVKRKVSSLATTGETGRKDNKAYLAFP